MRNASFLDIEITANSNDNSQSQLCDHQSRRMKLSTYMSSGKKGDPGYFVLCRISNYANQWCTEECTWQGVFCLHSIQFALSFFTAPPIGGRTNGINLRLAMRGHFLHNVIEILDGEILDFQRGAPVVSFIDRRENIADSTQGGAPKRSLYIWSSLSPPIN